MWNLTPGSPCDGTKVNRWPLFSALLPAHDPHKVYTGEENAVKTSVWALSSYLGISHGLGEVSTFHYLYTNSPIKKSKT